MNRLYKLIVLISGICLFSITNAQASSLQSIIDKSEISKNATVSVSVRKLTNDDVVYENFSKKLMHPASTLKAFTTPVTHSILGDNYNFKTGIYKYGNDSVFLKLAADPTFTAQNLQSLISALRNTNLKQPQNFYLDDTIVDDTEYGIGWMWDDEFSPFMPKYSRYNLDGNIYTLIVKPNFSTKKVEIQKPYNYNVSVSNRLKVGSGNNIVVKRNFWEGTENVILTGTITTQTALKIPVYNQKRYFISVLQDIMNLSNINYYGTFESKKTPADAVLIKEYQTAIAPMYKRIMKDSDNMVAETLFKLAGGKFYNTQGTTAYGVDALKNYYKNIGVPTDDIIIVDASGVSRNDLLSTDWMTKALVKIYQNDKTFNYKDLFNIPNEGTMKNRLFELRDYLWVKTGTLANISGLTGYIKTKSGNEYAFAILIQNSNAKEKDIKNLEDEIVTTIYKKY